MAQSQPKLENVQAEYARYDEKNVRPIELIGGRLVEKEGASLTHSRITTRMVKALNSHFQYKEYEAVASSLRVYVEATEDNFYPDAFVASYDAQFHKTLPHTILNPLILVEVLSLSTEKRDREDKLTAYLKIPSLQHYLIVSQDRVMIQLYSRSDTEGWFFADYHWRREVMVLKSLHLPIALEEIYCDLDVPQGLTVAPST